MGLYMMGVCTSGVRTVGVRAASLNGYKQPSTEHFFFTCHYTQERKKDCQASSLRFWLKKIEKNETVCLVTTLWLQLHIVDCDGQCISAPLKHSQAWFSFLLPHTLWSAAVNPLVPSRAELVSTEMFLLKLWVSSAVSIGSTTGKSRMQWERVFWEREFEASTSERVRLVSWLESALRRTYKSAFGTDFLKFPCLCLSLFLNPDFYHLDKVCLFFEFRFLRHSQTNC